MNCYNKKKVKTTIILQSKINDQKTTMLINLKKNRTLLVGPSFSGKTYPMLKILSRISNQGFYIVTKSHTEHYSDSKIKSKGKGEEIKTLSEYENALIVFDDILGSSTSNYIDQFFIRCRHKNLDIYHISQSYFDLTKRTKRNNGNKIILFNQTLKDIEKNIERRWWI